MSHALSLPLVPLSNLRNNNVSCHSMFDPTSLLPKPLTDVASKWAFLDAIGSLQGGALDGFSMSILRKVNVALSSLRNAHVNLSI